MRPITLLFLILSPCLLRAESLVLNGSDLLAPILRERILAFAEEESIRLLVDFDGSLKAQKALANRSADFALLAFPETSSLPGGTMSVPFAFQVITVAVNESNPIENIHYETLFEMFRENGTLQEWGSVVDEPLWSNRKIALAAIRDRSTIALEIFNSKVMNGEAMKRTIRFSENPDFLTSILSDNENTLALLPPVEVPPLAKLVPVSKNAESQAYSPTPDNIQFGDYPLRLPFIIAWQTSKSDSPALRSVLNFLFSDEISALLRENYFQPLPAAERRVYRDEFSNE